MQDTVELLTFRIAALREALSDVRAIDPHNPETDKDACSLIADAALRVDDERAAIPTELTDIHARVRRT